MLKQKLDVIASKLSALSQEQERLLQIERDIAQQETQFLRYCHSSLA